MAVLLTDGQQTRKGDFIEPSVAIMPLKRIGVQIYAVGIGKEAKRFELELIADTKEGVYMLPDFNNLANHDFIAKFTFGCNAGMISIIFLLEK